MRSYLTSSLLSLISLLLLAGCAGQVSILTPTPTPSPTITPNIPATVTEAVLFGAQTAEAALTAASAVEDQARATAESAADLQATAHAAAADSEAAAATLESIAESNADEAQTAQAEFVAAAAAGATAQAQADTLATEAALDVTLLEAMQSTLTAQRTAAAAAQSTLEAQGQAALETVQVTIIAQSEELGAANDALAAAEATLNSLAATTTAEALRPTTTPIVVTIPVLITATPMPTSIDLFATATALMSSPAPTPAAVTATPIALAEDWTRRDLPDLGISIEVPASFSPPQVNELGSWTFRSATGAETDGLTLQLASTAQLLQNVIEPPSDDKRTDPAAMLQALLLQALVTLPASAGTDLVVLDDVTDVPGASFPAARVRVQMVDVVNPTEVVLLYLGNDTWLSLLLSGSEADIATWVAHIPASLELLDEAAVPTPAVAASIEDWQNITLLELGLSFDYPAAWTGIEAFEDTAILTPGGADDVATILVFRLELDILLEPLLDQEAIDLDDPGAVLAALIEAETLTDEQNILVSEAPVDIGGQGYRAAYIVLESTFDDGAPLATTIALLLTDEGSRWYLLGVLTDTQAQAIELTERALNSMQIIQPAATPTPVPSSTPLPTFTPPPTLPPTWTPLPSATPIAQASSEDIDTLGLTFDLPDGWEIAALGSNLPIFTLGPAGTDLNTDANIGTRIRVVRVSAEQITALGFAEGEADAITALRAIAEEFVQSAPDFTGARVREVQIGAFSGAWTQLVAASTGMTARFYLFRLSQDWLLIHALAPSDAFAPFLQNELATFLNSLAEAETTEQAIEPSGPVQEALVLHVSDGDTLTVLLDGNEESVRYIGVDTPEAHHPESGATWLGYEATHFNEVLVPPGSTVLLEMDARDRDDFGRLLRYIWVEGDDGALILVQAELLRAGLARVRTFDEDRYVPLYLAIEREAQRERRGIWGAPPPQPPVDPIARLNDQVWAASPEGERMALLYDAAALGNVPDPVALWPNNIAAVVRDVYYVYPTDVDPVTGEAVSEDKVGYWYWLEINDFRGWVPEAWLLLDAPENPTAPPDTDLIAYAEPYINSDAPVDVLSAPDEGAVLGTLEPGSRAQVSRLGVDAGGAWWLWVDTNGLDGWVPLANLSRANPAN